MDDDDDNDNLVFYVPFNMAYANRADPDQTYPEGAVRSRSPMFATPLEYFKKWMHENQTLGKKEVFKIFHLPYLPCKK